MTVLNIDCMDFMKTMPDKFFELAIVDPPYGININENMGLKKGQKKRHTKKAEWDSEIPNPEYFLELKRVSKNQIVWGGNYFPDLWVNGCSHFIFWDKQTPVGMSFSDGELAWTSFNKANRKYTLFNEKGGKIHPTQKPVKLYKWLLKNYAKEGDKIFDSHMGSQSSRIAAYDTGFDYYGCELDKDYFDSGNKRFEQFKSQLKIF